VAVASAAVAVAATGADVVDSLPVEEAVVASVVVAEETAVDVEAAVVEETAVVALPGEDAAHQEAVVVLAVAEARGVARTFILQATFKMKKKKKTNRIAARLWSSPTVTQVSSSPAERRISSLPRI
jgi:hypothetical protein